MTGGVGAFDGVPALVESVFFMGTDVLGSESISMGAGPRGAAVGRGGCGFSWTGRGGAWRFDTMAGDKGAEVTEFAGCSLAGGTYVEFEALGGSIRDVMDGDALARLRGGEMGGGCDATSGLDSKIPPRMGS